jgi:hypothetical protein
MSKGFEQYTYKLTDIERYILITAIIKAWERKRIGEKVTASEMIGGLNDFCKKHNILNAHNKQYKVHGARLRKMIHYIRNRNLICNLIANQSGYWKSSDSSEIISFIDSCEERGSSLIATAEALKSRLTRQQ